MSFSKEEFDIMVEELLYKDPISYDMLCHIAEKTLRPKVEYWCNTEPILNGREYENDIMQEIHLRLMKKTITHFLLKDGVGCINYDPAGFKSWMFTVAENLKKDFLKKLRNIEFKTEDIENIKLEKELIAEVESMDEDGREKLKNAFAIVLAADVNIYKILTWIAQFIFIICFNITKIESNEEIIEAFEKKTLFEMYDMLYRLSKQIEWIEISDAQNENILKALNKNYRSKQVYGDVMLEEFFMYYKGKKSGKKSISDWVSRLNKKLCKIYEKSTKSEGEQK